MPACAMECLLAGTATRIDPTLTESKKVVRNLLHQASAFPQGCVIPAVAQKMGKVSASSPHKGSETRDSVAGIAAVVCQIHNKRHRLVARLCAVVCMQIILSET